MHVRLFQSSPALTVITCRAGRHQICPLVLPAQMSRDDMVHRQTAIAFTAILAGIIIASEEFAAR